MHYRPLAAALACAVVAVPASAQSDEARRFGVRESVENISLSPDGTRVVYLSPGPGRTTLVYVADIASGESKEILSSDGAPESLTSCRWSSTTRIVCNVYMLEVEDIGLVGYTRMVALDAKGGGLKLLSARTNARSLGVAQGGGRIIDWLPGGAEGSVLMARTFVPENQTATRMSSARQGFGVERVDTATLRRSTVEQPRDEAVTYLTDGHGTVRVMGTAEVDGTSLTGGYRFSYRAPGSRDWKPLATYDSRTDTGFWPVAVDRDLNVAYGFQRLDGREALYRIDLDGTLKQTLVFSHPQVDVDGLIRIGRQQRVVGVSYATERRVSQLFDPAIKAVAASLSKALPGLPLVSIVDASLDENRLLLWAGSDVDPGRYYVFDRKAKQLTEIMLSRPQLEETRLAQVKPVVFKTADGTDIPAYLTLPAGSAGKNLPAIVMPHGGPWSRDEWGFDWLSQFFAARGYAVLQPNFRGSSGYGDTWFVNNGFKAWRTAIGDVNDGGRWLVSQGIAAPDKLAIVGWSYGGYAALQSSVLDPALFKAIVAIAPVTDLEELKKQAKDFVNVRLVARYIGTGPHIVEGSPARNAGRIAAPVLLFHGDRDANVEVLQSRMMESRLKGAGKRVELVVFPGLDHQLPDSGARIQMLDKADKFLRSALGL